MLNKYFKFSTHLLIFVVAVLSLFMINLNIINAWTADDATISNVVVEDNTLKSFNLRFDVPDNLGETTSWVGIQSEMFDEGDPDNSVYGDLTDSGTVYNKRYSDINAVMADNNFVNEYGIVSINQEGFPCFGDYSTIRTTVSNLNISLDVNKTYYVYLWTYYNGSFYPDARIASINVNNGLITATDISDTELKLDGPILIDRVDIEGVNLKLKVGSKPSLTARIVNDAEKYNL